MRTSKNYSNSLDWRLDKAVDRGNPCEVSGLLTKGANPNCRPSFGIPVLQTAVERGFLEVVKELIKAGSDPNARNSDGNRPLSFAVLRGHGAIAKLLIESGADDQGVTPLMIACMEGNLKIVRDLIEWGADVNAKTLEGFGVHTPLRLAAFKGHVEITVALIDAGADVNATGVMHDAILEGHLAVVQLLLERGADVNKRFNNSMNPIHVACACDNLEIVKMLMSQGANWDAEIEGEGMTPLFLCMERGKLALAEMLLRAEVNPDIGVHGVTPLLYATFNGDTDFARLLIEHGADMTIRDPKGKTALQYAKEYGHDEIVALLKRAGAKE